jgi:hypothetical protein
VEQWKAVPGFPGRFVSNFGRVKSDHRGLLKGHTITRNGKPRCVTVLFTERGRQHTRSVHRLVLEAFVGPCPPGMEGCHNNGDGSDNRLENLRWDTHAANMQDAIRHGTFVRPLGFKAKPSIRRGEANNKTVITETQARDIKRRLSLGERQCHIARSHNVKKHVVQGIASGDSWAWL